MKIATQINYLKSIMVCFLGFRFMLDAQQICKKYLKYNYLKLNIIQPNVARAKPMCGLSGSALKKNACMVNALNFLDMTSFSCMIKVHCTILKCKSFLLKAYISTNQ